MTTQQIPMVISALMTLAACGGPQVRFDPGPAPGWIRAVPAEVGAQALAAVGEAPATTDESRDRDLATRDAKARVAKLIQSKIASRTSDWSLAMTGGATDASRDVVQESVEVRSDVTVEDVAVESSYRDEASRTHYVRIGVDRAAWVQRLRGRIDDGMKAAGASLEAARQVIAQRPLRAFEALLEASARGRAVEPDVVVSDLLDRSLGARSRLQSLKEQVDTLSRSLRDEHRFVLLVQAPDPQVATRVRGDLRQFLGTWGFVVSDREPPGRGIHIDIRLGQHHVATEQVAGRTEYVHAGTGTLLVRDADGSEVAALAVRFESDRYQERDVDGKKAAAKALGLAADTVSAKFRSAFRNAYARAE